MAAALAALAAVPGLFDIDRKLLFVHIPKNGGTAIEDAIRGYQSNHSAMQPLLPCSFPKGWCGSDGALERACREYDQSLGKLSPITNLQEVGPLWGNYAHHTDAMSRCALSRFYPLESVNTSYALIRDPIERAVSAWDWMQQHEPTHMQRFTFEEYVKSPYGLARDPFGVPQCAFIATKSGQSHCTHPTDTTDRVTRLFPYTHDLEEQPDFLAFLRSYYPGISLHHNNTARDGDGSVNISSAELAAASPEIQREGSTIDVSARARTAILQHYSEDMQLYLSLFDKRAADEPPSEAELPSLRCSLLFASGSSSTRGRGGGHDSWKCADITDVPAAGSVAPRAVPGALQPV